MCQKKSVSSSQLRRAVKVLKSASRVNGGGAKGFGAVGGKVCPVLDGGRIVVNGGAV